MSFSSLFSIGVSAVNAFAAGLGAVASNIANTQTTGFKEVRADFSELLPRNEAAPGRAPGADAVGTGAAATLRPRASAQGAIIRTNEAANLALTGQGFFVASADETPEAGAASLLFTRAGGFRPTETGALVNEAGLFLQGAPTQNAAAASSAFGLSGLETINLNRTPPNAPVSLGALTGFDIAADGALSATYANGATRILYRIPIAVFRNPEGLEAAGETAFSPSPASGEPTLLAPGAGAAGRIEAQALEQSTADVGASLAALIELQRGYATGARTLTTADELWRILNETAA